MSKTANFFLTLLAVLAIVGLVGYGLNTWTERVTKKQDSYFNSTGNARIKTSDGWETSAETSSH